MPKTRWCVLQLAVSLVVVVVADNADRDDEISDHDLHDSKLAEVWTREPLLWLQDYEKGDRHLWNQKRRLWLKDYERGNNAIEDTMALHDHRMQGDDPGVGGLRGNMSDERLPGQVPPRDDIHIVRLPGNDPSKETKNQHFKCPPVPLLMGLQQCIVAQCNPKGACDEGEKCCPNGCVNTCQKAQHRPTLIDWDTQPRSLFQEKRGWIIEDPRNDMIESLAGRVGSNAFKRGCVFGGVSRPHGEHFQYEGRSCTCNFGEMDCSITLAGNARTEN